MEKLRNLNELNRGIYKQWIWGSKDNYYRSCNFLQKINYCIQDLNIEIENLSKPTMKEVVFVIALVDWIYEAVNSIPKILKPNIAAFVSYETEDIIKSEKYLRAIRSFVVAHPLTTNRHKDYGFDGDMICIDVRKKTSDLAMHSRSDWFYLDFDGLKQLIDDKPSDFVLYVYSQKADGMRFFKFIRANFSDLYTVARLQIEKLYMFDKQLKKLKRRDFI